MSVALRELVSYLDALLEPWRFQDYCPNGLQVEGRSQVAKVASGVTASQRLLDAAAEWGADAILVHHGYFWKGEEQAVVGMKRRRLATLLGHDISLLAYHLPLDDHPTLGNNARLGELLGLQDHRPLQSGGEGVGNIAELPAALPVSELLASLRRITGREPLHIAADVAGVRHIAWCTGAAGLHRGGNCRGRGRVYYGRGLRANGTYCPGRGHSLYRRRTPRHRALRSAGGGRTVGAGVLIAAPLYRY